MNYETIVQDLVKYTFSTSFLAFAGSAMFFFACKDYVAPRYRINMVVSGCISSIAAYMYYLMKSVYQVGTTFPTEMRYIDWCVTTPLLLIQFSLLLGYRLNSSIVWKLVLCDLFMIISGYVGETFGFSAGNLPYRWMLFGFAMTGWLGILVYLYRGVLEQAKLDDAHVQKALVILAKFVTFGWMLYPIGYVVRAVYPNATDTCQLAYNVGDLINKVGFGAVLFVMGISSLRATAQAAESKSSTAAPATPAPAPVAPAPAPVAPAPAAVAPAPAPVAPAPAPVAPAPAAPVAPAPAAPANTAAKPAASDVKTGQQAMLEQARIEADYKARLEKLRQEMEVEIMKAEQGKNE